MAENNRSKEVPEELQKVIGKFLEEPWHGGASRVPPNLVEAYSKFANGVYPFLSEQHLLHWHKRDNA